MITKKFSPENINNFLLKTLIVANSARNFPQNLKILHIDFIHKIFSYKKFSDNMIFANNF